MKYSVRWVGFALFIAFFSCWVPNANVVSSGIWALEYILMKPLQRETCRFCESSSINETTSSQTSCVGFGVNFYFLVKVNVNKIIHQWKNGCNDRIGLK